MIITNLKVLLLAEILENEYYMRDPLFSAKQSEALLEYIARVYRLLFPKSYYVVRVEY